MERRARTTRRSKVRRPRDKHAPAPRGHAPIWRDPREFTAIIRSLALAAATIYAIVASNADVTKKISGENTAIFDVLVDTYKKVDDVSRP